MVGQSKFFGSAKKNPLWCPAQSNVFFGSAKKKPQCLPVWLLARLVSDSSQSVARPLSDSSLSVAWPVSDGLLSVARPESHSSKSVPRRTYRSPGSSLAGHYRFYSHPAALGLSTGQPRPVH
jgi:hypothetical protein